MRTQETCRAEVKDCLLFALSKLSMSEGLQRALSYMQAPGLGLMVFQCPEAHSPQLPNDACWELSEFQFLLLGLEMGDRRHGC